RYEFAMQARRKALWIGMLLLCTLVFRNFTWFYFDDPRVPSAAAAVIAWTSIVALFFPLGAGLLLADRYARDRKTRMDELLATAPASGLSRLGGKYLGSVLATLLPILLVQLAGTALIAAHWRDPGVIPLSLGAFAATSVVGILFVGAFSIACTTVL